MNWNICCCKCTIAHAIMLCVSLRIIFIFTHKWERCVNISAICWHIKHLTTWMRDINKYAERTGAVHEWHQPFLGSLLPLTGYVTMVSSFVLPFYASKLMTSPPCYILSSFSVTLAVRCSCNIISGQPLPYKRGWQCWLPSSALCQVQFSVLRVSGVLPPLATGYSGYPPARNTEISDPRHGAAVRPRSPASPELRLSVTHQ